MCKIKKAELRKAKAQSKLTLILIQAKKIDSFKNFFIYIQ